MTVHSRDCDVLEKCLFLSLGQEIQNGPRTSYHSRYFKSYWNYEGYDPPPHQKQEPYLRNSHWPTALTWLWSSLWIHVIFCRDTMTEKCWTVSIQWISNWQNSQMQKFLQIKAWFISFNSYRQGKWLLWARIVVTFGRREKDCDGNGAYTLSTRDADKVAFFDWVGMF